MLTQERVRELFRYSKTTGLLTRKQRRGKGRAGESSKCHDRDGYLVVGIDSKTYRTHRVIWLYVTGAFPEADIDHKNRIRDDNRWTNLRSVTRSQNKQNQLAAVNNKSGAKGVYPHQGRWQAAIEHLGVRYDLGGFNSICEAAAAYSKKAKELHEFNPCAKR